MVLKNTKLFKITSGILILLVAFVLLNVTRASLPSVEVPVNEPCFIEDCVSGVRQAGFPFRAYELSRSEGLNCSGNHADENYCNAVDLKRPYVLFINYLFYVGVLTGVFLIVRKLKFS